MDCLIGAVFNGPAGKMNEYLGLGGGMKVDAFFTGKRGYGGGIFMNAYFNDLEKDYPINTTRTQNGSQPILLIGLALSKVIPLNERRELIAQFEAGLHFKIFHRAQTTMIRTIFSLKALVQVFLYIMR